MGRYRLNEIKESGSTWIGSPLNSQIWKDISQASAFSRLGSVTLREKCIGLDISDWIERGRYRIAVA